MFIATYPLSHHLVYTRVSPPKNKIYKTLDNRVQTPPTTGRRGDRVVTSIPGGIRSGITGNLVVDLYTVQLLSVKYLGLFFLSVTERPLCSTAKKTGQGQGNISSLYYIKPS